MKKSKELLGLTVISIEDGKDLGHVIDFVINPSKGAVEFLIIDGGVKYLGLKALPFGLVEGVGEYAVTVQSADALTELSEEADIKGLLEKKVHVIGTRVLTKKGKLIGTVSEFLVDDDSAGKISGCELDPGDHPDERSIIPADQIITFGKDILVVQEGVSGGPTKPTTDSGVQRPNDEPASTAGETAVSAETSQAVESELTEEAGQTEQNAIQDEPDDLPVDQTEETGKNAGQAAGESQTSQAAVMFEQRQRKYLIGRKVTKRIETDNGELIVEEGQVVTEALLDRAKQTGKFAELSMNTKP